MSKEIKVRWGWLKAMYIYTIAGAGGFGLAIIFATYIIGDLIAIPLTPRIILHQAFFICSEGWS